MGTYSFVVVIAPGCHRSPIAPIISRHRTLRAAVVAARRSDRTRVEPAESSVYLYQAEPHGYSLYGGRDTRPLREALAMATAEWAAWRAER